MNDFDYGTAHDIFIADVPAMKKALAISDFPSCEYACNNLVIWSETYHNTRLFEYENRMYFHMPSIDELLFPCGGSASPSPQELHLCSEGMKRAGYSGTIAHVPASFIQTAGLEEFYEIRPMDIGEDEYIYRTEALAQLHGSKLSKKRNLISQFERNYDDFQIRNIETVEDFRKVIELSNDWIREHLDSEEIENERKAINKALTHYQELGFEGLILETPEGIKAFAVFSRLNSNSYTIHFEKAHSECKGASQVITNQTAIYLQGKCEFINREQDLNIPGLRQAKQSYMPDHMLKDFLLIPKS